MNGQIQLHTHNKQIDSRLFKLLTFFFWDPIDMCTESLPLPLHITHITMNGFKCQYLCVMQCYRLWSTNKGEKNMQIIHESSTLNLFTNTILNTLTETRFFLSVLFSWTSLLFLFVDYWVHMYTYNYIIR